MKEKIFYINIKNILNKILIKIIEIDIFGFHEKASLKKRFLEFQHKIV